MSGPSLMGAILSDAIASSTGLVGQATSLTATAVAALEKTLTLNGGDVLRYTVDTPDYQVFYTKGGFLDGLPVVPGRSPDAVPAVIEAPVTAPLDVPDAPEINPLLNSEVFPGHPGRFTQAIPTIDGFVENRDLPDVTIEASPQLTPLQQPRSSLDLQVPETFFAGIPTQFTLPDHAAELENIKDLIYNGRDGLPGFNALDEDLSKFSEQIIHDLLPLLAQEFQERFTALYTPANARKESLLESLSQQSLLPIEARQEHVHRTLSTAGGWKLPSLVQAALQHTLNEQIDPYMAQNLSKRRMQIIENANKLLSLYLELYSKLRMGIEEVKNKEMEMLLTAHKNAQAYAKDAVEVLLRIFEVEQYKLYDLIYKQKEGELKVFEQQLQADLLRYEEVRANLEIEKAKQDYDKQQVRILEVELMARESAIQVLAKEMDLIAQGFEMKKIPLEIMKAKIGAFGTRVLVEEAKLKKRAAQIDKKEFLVRQESNKVSIYEDQIQAFERIINTKEQFLNEQINTNEARISAYASAVKGALIPVKYSALEEQHKLYAHEAAARVYQEEARMAIQEAKMTAEFERQKKETQDEMAKILNEIAVELQGIELDRRKTVADVNLRGASIFASMAEGAMSAANLVAGGALEEFA